MAAAIEHLSSAPSQALAGLSTVRGENSVRADSFVEILSQGWQEAVDARILAS